MRDRVVVEIGVIAQKKNEALPLWEPGNALAYSTVIVPGRLKNACLELVGSFSCAFAPTGRLVAGRVDHDPPDPRLQRAFTAICGSLTHRDRKSLLNRIKPSFPIASDRGRNAPQLAQPQPVHRLDRIERGSCLSDHLDMTVRQARFL